MKKFIIDTIRCDSIKRPWACLSSASAVNGSLLFHNSHFLGVNRHNVNPNASDRDAGEILYFGLLDAQSMHLGALPLEEETIMKGSMQTTTGNASPPLPAWVSSRFIADHLGFYLSNHRSSSQGLQLWAREARRLATRGRGPPDVCSPLCTGEYADMLAALSEVTRSRSMIRQHASHLSDPSMAGSAAGAETLREAMEHYALLADRELLKFLGNGIEKVQAIADAPIHDPSFNVMEYERRAIEIIEGDGCAGLWAVTTKHPEGSSSHAIASAHVFSCGNAVALCLRKALVEEFIKLNRQWDSAQGAYFSKHTTVQSEDDTGRFYNFTNTFRKNHLSLLSNQHSFLSAETRSGRIVFSQGNDAERRRMMAAVSRKSVFTDAELRCEKNLSHLIRNPLPLCSRGFGLIDYKRAIRGGGPTGSARQPLQVDQIIVPSPDSICIDLSQGDIIVMMNREVLKRPDVQIDASLPDDQALISVDDIAEQFLFDLLAECRAIAQDPGEPTGSLLDRIQLENVAARLLRHALGGGRNLQVQVLRVPEAITSSPEPCGAVNTTIIPGPIHAEAYKSQPFTYFYTAHDYLTRCDLTLAAALRRRWELLESLLSSSTGSKINALNATAYSDPASLCYPSLMSPVAWQLQREAKYFQGIPLASECAKEYNRLKTQIIFERLAESLRPKP